MAGFIGGSDESFNSCVGGQTTTPDEIRGESIEGGTLYPVKAGDTLYIPANMPHQFFVEKGKHWVITLVKITPKP